jgi:DNA-binding transcriptional ArsR family regulator
VADATVMRALAHPARLEILDYLGGRDSATATECAEVVGLSPSATSYHLRELARYGMIHEAPGRGDRRERRWSSAGTGWYSEAGPDADAATQAAERALAETAIARSERRARDFWAHAGSESREWYDVSAFAEATLLLTAAEVATLTAAMDAAMSPYRGRKPADAPPGARRSAVVYRAFPIVESARPGHPEQDPPDA